MTYAGVEVVLIPGLGCRCFTIQGPPESEEAASEPADQGCHPKGV